MPAYSKAETKRLVEEGIRRLPAKYRVVVLLRDIEQLLWGYAALFQRHSQAAQEDLGIVESSFPELLHAGQLGCSVSSVPLPPNRHLRRSMVNCIAVFS